MNLKYNLKILAYKFFHTRFGRAILDLFSGKVKVEGLIGKSLPKNFPFLVCITIDTEAGYTKDNDHRLWQKDAPREYVGYTKGVENWRDLLNKHDAKGTFFLSTNCFSAKDQTEIKKQLKFLTTEEHEIGLHLHPDSDLALQKELGKKFSATSADFYTKSEIEEFVKTGKNLIQKNTKINPVSFRWGNWALNKDAISALEKNGFVVDSSATPQIKGHLGDEMEFDWEKISRRQPWKLSKKDYLNTKNQDSKVLEIPIATFDFFGIKTRADPANSELLKIVFDRYYEEADRSKKPFAFVIISHSIESTHQDGSKTRIIKGIDKFIDYVKKRGDVRFVTIKEAYGLVK